MTTRILALSSLLITLFAGLTPVESRSSEESVGPVIRMPAMNVFRRYAAQDPT